MVLGCGAKVFKYCLFAFNLIFFIAGIICIAIGTWLAVDKEAGNRLATAAREVEGAAGDKELQELENRTQFVRDAGIILVVGGAIILVIAFLGCCGAVKEWRPLLVLYAIFLLLILAVELAAAIYAAVNKGSLEDQIKKGLLKSLEYYDEQGGVRAAWDEIMKDHQCCGTDGGASDFAKSKWKAANPATMYPPACCGSTDTCSESNKFDKGCFEALKEAMEKRAGIVIGVGVAVALIQVVGVTFALCLCKSISQEGGSMA